MIGKNCKGALNRIAKVSKGSVIEISRTSRTEELHGLDALVLQIQVDEDDRLDFRAESGIRQRANTSEENRKTGHDARESDRELFRSLHGVDNGQNEPNAFPSEDGSADHEGEVDWVEGLDVGYTLTGNDGGLRTDDVDD